MTIRTIIRYPDPRLALAAQPVTTFDDRCGTAGDLLETITPRPGSGSPRRISASPCGWWCSTSTRSMARGLMSS